MTAAQLRDLIEKSLDSGLSDAGKIALQSEIEAHLPRFPQLQREWDAAQATRRALQTARDAQAPAPPFLRSNVRAALVEAANQPSKTPRWLLFARPLWAGGAVAALGLFLVARGVIGPNDPLSPPLVSSPPAIQIPIATTPSSTQNLPLKPSNKQQSRISPQAKPTNSQKNRLAKQQAPTSAPERSTERTVRPKNQTVRLTEPSSDTVKRPTRALSQPAMPAPALSSSAPRQNTPSPAIKPRPDASKTEKSTPPKRPEVNPAPFAASPPAPATAFNAREALQSPSETSPTLNSVPRLDIPATRNSTADTGVARTMAVPESAAAAAGAPEQELRSRGEITTLNSAKTPISLSAQLLPDLKTELKNARSQMRNGGQVTEENARSSADSSALQRVRVRIEAERDEKNLRLLQRQAEVWRGDLVAKKPLELELQTPTNEREIELILERIPSNAATKENTFKDTPLTLRAPIIGAPRR